MDEEGVSWSQLTAWTPSEVSKAFNCCERALPMRHQEIHFLKLPWAMTLVFQFAKSLLSEKIRKRFKTHSGLESLHKCMDKCVLPAEYGGTTPIKDCISQWKQELETSRSSLLSLDMMQVNMVSITDTIMVLTLDGNSEHVAHAWRKIHLFGEKKTDL